MIITTPEVRAPLDIEGSDFQITHRWHKGKGGNHDDAMKLSTIAASITVAMLFVRTAPVASVAGRR